MVGNTLPSFIDQRQQELTGIKKPFGNVSTIAFRDRYKLQSVCDSWVFIDLKSRSIFIGTKGLGSIRGVFGPMSKINFTLSNYRFVIWDKNYRRYFVI